MFVKPSLGWCGRVDGQQSPPQRDMATAIEWPASTLRKEIVLAVPPTGDRGLQGISALGELPPLH